MNWSARLASPKLRVAAVAIGVLLAAPSITTGRVTDDWLQQLELEHRPIDGMSQRPLDLFTFATGDPTANHKLVDAGMFPWWTHPEVKLSFFRPITALTHALDYALWPDAPVRMHLQNLLWFALALIAAGWVFGRFLTPATAGLALLLYAIDDAHGPAVGWIANRNAMVTVALGLPALGLHHRWRADQWRPGRWLAPLSLLLGLLAGEAAVAVLCYLGAYALHVERGTLREKALSLLPYLVVLVGWRAVYTRLGYGTAHSGVYIDPAHDPIGFLAAFPARAAALLASQYAAPWSDFAPLYQYLGPRAALTMTALALLTLAVLLYAFRSLLRTDPATRMFATGALLATIPIAATFPADRLLFFVSVGAMAVIARFLMEPRRGFARLVGWGLVAIHLVLAPPLLALRSRSMETVEKPIARSLASVPRDPSRTVVLVNPPLDPLAGYLLPGMAAKGEARPAALRWLATGTSRLEVTRDDAQTLTIRSTPGFVANASEQMLRATEDPLRPGDRIELTGMGVEILETDAATGHPHAVRFRFAVPLEDPSLAWLRWGTTRYEPWTPPAVGETVVLAPVDALQATFGPEPG